MPKKAARKPVAKKVAKPAKAAKKVTKTKPVKKAKSARKAAAPETLGRPLVTAEEKLYMLFKEDYHARQIFEFLRVNTVGELEQYSPQQITHILSTPIRTTVDRIRQRLADLKRHLRDDLTYAHEYRATRPAE